MIIYYFTGTGNSLYVAKKLNERLGASLINMAKDERKMDSDAMGFVFPMYNHTVPTLVMDYIEGMSDLSNRYIFAICTYGHSPGITMKHLKKAIEAKGGKLALGYAIKMPYNYIQPERFKLRGLFESFVLNENTDYQVDYLTSLSKIKVAEIAKDIERRKTGKLETSHVMIETLVNGMGLRDTAQKKSWAKVAGTYISKEENFREMLKHMDDGFWVNDQCVSCGICSKVCPTENIDIMIGPKWYGRCEQCFACLHWCPEDAIEFRNCTEGRLRYHHPEVGINEII